MMIKEERLQELLLDDGRLREKAFALFLLDYDTPDPIEQYLRYVRDNALMVGREQALQTLAVGLKKAFPDIAEQMVQAWKDATGENLLKALLEGA